MPEQAEFVVPSDGAGPRPGVLVFHGGGGLSEHERVQLQRFAALGYVAHAPDLFGEVFTDRARGAAVIGELVATPSLLRARTTAALDKLAGHAAVDAQRIAAVGHCFGGLAALELARSGATIRAAVSFHGRFTTAAPAQRGAVKARVLACTGADDPHCPRDTWLAFEQEMTAAGVDWQHHVYGATVHGFSVPGIDALNYPGCAYNAVADRRSWAAMRALLEEVL
jgi:dienelactone hydrolase